MRLWRIVAVWLPLAALSTGLVLFIYLAVQQSYRHLADDPQMQLAEDTASALQTGQEPTAVVPTGQVDMAASLAPFVMVLSSSGAPLASSGQLNNTTPTPPMGVLTYATAHGLNRFSWQPRSDVREAAIVVPYHTASSSGYVLAARSLREVENRESELTGLAEVTLFGALVMSLLAALAVLVGTSRPEAKPPHKPRKS
jgi:hypothetical protein